MDPATLENMLSTRGVLDKSTLAWAVAKGLSCGVVSMLVIGWLVCWFVSSGLRQFAGSASSLLDALPIATEARLFKASASSSVDSSCRIRSRSCSIYSEF